MIVRVPVRATKADLLRVAAENPAWKVELEADGTLVLRPPSGGVTGHRNAWLTRVLYDWAIEHGYVPFDSSTGYEFSDGTIISPDGSLVRKERHEALTPDEREAFLPLVPDIVIELASKSDRPAALRAKLADVRRRGAEYVLLLDPYRNETWSDGIAPPTFPDLTAVYDR